MKSAISCVAVVCSLFASFSFANAAPLRFASAMADEAVFFGTYGVADKRELVAEQRDSVKTCAVKSYALTNLRSISIDRDAAILLSTSSAPKSPPQIPKNLDEIQLIKSDYIRS
ncbi:MAG TPA: hypothetical protein VJN93_05115 [Candidatus Acidoferrum sp.]|nr:hypothetical protein [Candidatus Acidoferrum sp.]